MKSADARRYARQIALLGPDGQERLLATTALLHDQSLRAAVAARYLEAAGISVIRNATSRWDIEVTAIAHATPVAPTGTPADDVLGGALDAADALCQALDHPARAPR